MNNYTFEDFIHELKQKNDLVSIASRYVHLEKRGSYFWCRCPFHGEKTPSLCISDSDNTFFCYGCHVGGDVIQFIMQIESLPFMDSVKLLAGWANMEVPSFNNSGGDDINKSKKRKDRLISLLKETAKFYYSNLSKPTAEPAREYMKKRLLDERISKKFGLGYSEGFNELYKHLQSLGFSDDEMIASGVIKQKDNRFYDPLAKRLIFPIIDIYENVVAFGGRSLEQKPDFAKYLNTAETEIFSKGSTLYAINNLKKQRQHGPIPFVIVVEGYMDTISLHRAGFTMTVASMGTALTQAQAKLIKRFSNKVYICYDGDAAGQNATLRGLDILKNNGLDVFVVQLPDRFDPDDVIKTYGKEGYQKILDESLPLSESKIKFLQSKFDISGLGGRVKFLNEAITVLAAINDSVERELYIPLVSEISNTNVDFIKLELEKKISGNEVESEIKSRLFNSTKHAKVSQDETTNNATVKAEKFVLFAFIHERPYVNFKTNIMFLFSENRKEIFNIINEQRFKPGGTLIERVLDAYKQFDQSQIADIINFGAMSCDDKMNEKKYYEDCLWLLYKNYLENKLKELSEEYSFEIDNLKKNQISEEMKDIISKLKNKKVDELWTEKKKLT